MKKNKILLFLSLFSLILTSCGGNNSSNKNSIDEENIKNSDLVVDVSFDTVDMSKFKINKFIYGTFIEFIEDCIYGGIWAEKVLDRKFYTPVGEGVSAWQVDKGTISALTGEEAFQQDYSPSLSSGFKISNIYFLALQKKKYTGYIWAKGDGVLTVSLSRGNNVISTDITVKSATFEKYEYEFDYDVETKAATYSLEAKEGTVAFDSISLMPADNYHGMRLDTLTALKELNATFYRYPGGNFVSGYDFYDGIGDIDKRPTVLNRHYCKEYGYHEGDSDEQALARANQAIGRNGWYGAFDPNDFGLEEFFDFCKYLNAEPNVVVNDGLGSAQMAANEVEFCNGSKTSTWGSKRIIQEEPYNVKIWGIGNEMYGSWQLGAVGIGEYVKRHNQFALAMKDVDPNIEIIAVGAGYSWNQSMMSSCSTNFDYLSIHFYPQRQETNVKDHILSLKNATTSCIDEFKRLSGRGNKTIAFDEYAFSKAEEPSRLKDGMAVASSLNTMIANGDVVDIACYSSTVNAVQGNVKATNFGAYMEGSGYAISLYVDNMLERYLPVKYKSLKDLEEYYEIAMTINEDKSQVTVSVINATEQVLCIRNEKFKEIVKYDMVSSENYYGNNTDTRIDLTREKGNINQEASTFLVEPRSIKLVTINL